MASKKKAKGKALASSVSAETYNRLLGTKAMLVDVNSALETGKVKVKGAQPATSGATAVILPPSVNKVVLQTRARGSKKWVDDYETDITARIDNFTFAPWNGMACLHDLFNNGYRLADETCDLVNGAPHRRVFYRRSLARIEVHGPVVDGVAPELYVEDDAYMDGDQVISRNPEDLFRALSLGEVVSQGNSFQLYRNGTPIADVRRPRVGDYFLDHVAVRDYENAMSAERHGFVSLVDYRRVRPSNSPFIGPRLPPPDIQITHIGVRDPRSGEVISNSVANNIELNVGDALVVNGTIENAERIRIFIDGNLQLLTPQEVQIPVSNQAENFFVSLAAFREEGTFTIWAEASANNRMVAESNRVNVQVSKPKLLYISPYGEGTIAEITSPFAYRRTYARRTELHAAWDTIRQGAGATPNICSIADGGIVVANRDGRPGQGGGYGYHIVIRYEDPRIGTFCAMYAHLNARSSLSEGSTVNQGDVIGVQGDTAGPGSRTGAFHLHFQTWRGSTVDYNPYSAFNPLTELYNLEMTRNSIDDSGIFAMRNVATYTWNSNFWRHHANDINNPQMFDQTVIDGMVTLLGFTRPS